MTRFPKKPASSEMVYKPKQLQAIPPPGIDDEQMRQFIEHSNEEIQLYRHANFLIIYNTFGQEGSVADLNGKTFLRHTGPVNEIFAIINAIQTLRAQNADKRLERIYPEAMQELSDEEFEDTGFEVMDQFINGDTGFDEDDFSDPLDDLIKPPSGT